MFKKLTIVAMAAGALGITAPVASAAHEQVSCRFNAVTQATATGQDTWEGVAEGYVIGNAGENVSVRCVVRVNGTVRAATDWGTGVTAATTQGRVTYTRTLTEVTQLCAQYTAASHGTGVREICFTTTTQQIPPQEVYDLVIDPLFDILIDIAEQIDSAIHDVELIVDQQICDDLTALNGSYGPVEIKPGTADPNTNARGGDVWVNGELFWDCPGYEP